MGNSVFVPHEFLATSSTSGFTLAVYCHLSMYVRCQHYKECPVNVHDIAYIMFGSIKKTHEIRESMDCIASCGLFRISKMALNEYVVHPCEFSEMNARFASVPHSIISKILQSEYTYKYELLKMVMLIISGRTLRHVKKNGKPYFNNHPIEWYIKIMGVNSSSTIIKYQTTLEQMGIIYISRSLYDSNIIGLYWDKDVIRSYSYNIRRKERKEHPSNARSLMRKYLWMAKGKKYPPDETEEVLNYIKEYNTRMEEGGYLDKVKDLSVFNLT